MEADSGCPGIEVILPRALPPSGPSLATPASAIRHFIRLVPGRPGRAARQDFDLCAPKDDIEPLDALVDRFMRQFRSKHARLVFLMGATALRAAANAGRRGHAWGGAALESEGK
jgi:hypothetical protein